MAEDNRDKISRSLSATQRAEADRLVAERLRQAKPQSSSIARAPAATLPADTPSAFRIQLGAFLAPERASALWQQLRVSQADLLNSLRHRVQRAERGGRVLHLLQAGPLANAKVLRP